MISTAELLSWTKAEAVDTDLLRSLERAAIATVENRTGRYFGVTAAQVEYRRWRGATLELRATPAGAVTIEYRDGSAWAEADTSTFYAVGRFIRAAGTVAWTTGTDLKISYTGGYTVDGVDANVWAAPEEIKDLVRTIVALRYLYREGVDQQGRKIDFDGIIDVMARDHKRVSA